jgi:hypothetical protein
MRFTRLFIAAGLVASISAKPIAFEEKRQVTAPAAVSSIVNTLVTSVNSNIITINGLIQSINQNVGVSVVAAINANLQAIQQSFGKATVDLLATTTGGVGGVVAIGQQFTGDQITQLAGDVSAVAALIQQIRVTAGLATTNLTPDVLAAINAELTAVQNAVQPFVTPLEQLATAVRNSNTTAFLQIQGLRDAVNGLASVVRGTVNRLLKLFGQQV